MKDIDAELTLKLIFTGEFGKLTNLMFLLEELDCNYILQLDSWTLMGNKQRVITITIPYEESCKYDIIKEIDKCLETYPTEWVTYFNEKFKKEKYKNER